jgi:hypothetical protein
LQSTQRSSASLDKGEKIRVKPTTIFNDDIIRWAALRVEFIVRNGAPKTDDLVRAGSHYGRPSREAVRLSGQTLLRVQRNEPKIANKI